MMARIVNLFVCCSEAETLRSCTSGQPGGGGPGHAHHPPAQFPAPAPAAAQSNSKSDSNVYRSVFWSIIVFASVVSGGFFLHDNTSEFLKSTVQTTLDSMVPLSQVLFPSVVVCNINQIRKSLFNELGFYDNETLVRIMYEDFIKGTKDNSENSTYLGSDFEDDEHHTIKRKEFYQVGLSKVSPSPFPSFVTHHLSHSIHVFNSPVVTLHISRS